MAPEEASKKEATKNGAEVDDLNDSFDLGDDIDITEVGYYLYHMVRYFISCLFHVYNIHQIIVIFCCIQEEINRLELISSGFESCLTKLKFDNKRPLALSQGYYHRPFSYSGKDSESNDVLWILKNFRMYTMAMETLTQLYQTSHINCMELSFNPVSLVE